MTFGGTPPLGMVAKCMLGTDPGPGAKLGTLTGAGVATVGGNPGGKGGPGGGGPATRLPGGLLGGGILEIMTPASHSENLQVQLNAD